jgi:outer membrane protein TolC
MKPIIILLLNLSLVTGIQTASFSQEKDAFDPLVDEISLRLPPLEVLIDSAISNNPQIQFRDQQLTINEYRLRSKRIEWTKSLGLRGNVGYGNMYDYTSSSNGVVEPVPVASIRSQSQYTATVFINLPLSTFADRKNQLNMAKSEISQARSSIEEQRLEIRQLVIFHFNELVLNQRIFVLKANKLESIKVNMEMVETQFMNGTVPLSEYTQLSSSVSETEIDYEKARMSFLNSYMVLEEIVGFKFNLFTASSGNNELN